MTRGDRAMTGISRYLHSNATRMQEMDEWRLPEGAVVLDPFVGAGTTLYVAAQRGYNWTPQWPV